MYVKKQKQQQFIRMLLFFVPDGFFRLLKAIKYRKYFSNAYIDERASISLGTKIGANTIITRDVSISANNCHIGANSSLQQYVDIRGGSGKIIIGDEVQIAPRVFIISESHNYKRKKTMPYNQIQNGVASGDLLCGDDYIFDDIVIGDGTWIGANSIILKGTHLGKGCVVGAGSVLTGGRYEDYSIIVGVPGKVIGSRKEFIYE